MLQLPAQDKSPERLAPVAAAIADAAEERPLFRGDDGAQKTALLLVAIAHHESSFRQSVGECRVLGDGGRAWGWFQVHREHFAGIEPTALCQNVRLQARAALDALWQQVRRGVRSAKGLVNGYASGNAGRDSWQSRELFDSFKSLVIRAEREPAS